MFQVFFVNQRVCRYTTVETKSRVLELLSAQLHNGARQETPADLTPPYELLKMRDASALHPCSCCCGFGFVYKNSFWDLCHHANEERGVTGVRWCGKRQASFNCSSSSSPWLSCPLHGEHNKFNTYVYTYVYPLWLDMFTETGFIIALQLHIST